MLGKVSVLLPVYNGEKYLCEQIDSIIDQDYENIHIYIRDDGSKDGSFDLIREYADNFPDQISIIKGPNTNIGLVQSIELLLRTAAPSDYYMFADQDDIWFSNKISSSVNEIRRLEILKAGPAAVCTDCICVDQNKKIISESFFKSQKFPTTTFESVERMIALNVVQGSTLIINRAALDVILPLPKWLNVHDSYIATHIANEGLIDYFHKPTMLYRQHGNNQLGEIKIGIKYYLHRFTKLVYTIKIINLYRRTFPTPPSFFKIIYYKIYYSLNRLL